MKKTTMVALALLCVTLALTLVQETAPPQEGGATQLVDHGGRPVAPPTPGGHLAPRGGGLPTRALLEEGGGATVQVRNNETHLAVPRSSPITVTWANYEDYTATEIELTVAQVAAETHYFGGHTRSGGTGVQAKPATTTECLARRIVVPYSFLWEGLHCYMGTSNDPQADGGSTALIQVLDESGDLPNHVVAENSSDFELWATGAQWRNQTLDWTTNVSSGTYFIAMNASALNYTAGHVDVDWLTCAQYTLAPNWKATYDATGSGWSASHYTMPLQAYGHRVTAAGSQWTGTAEAANVSYAVGDSLTYATSETTTLSLTGAAEQGDRTGTHSSLTLHIEGNQSVSCWLSWRVVYQFVAPAEPYAPDGGEQPRGDLKHPVKSYPGPWVSTWQPTTLRERWGWWFVLIPLVCLPCGFLWDCTSPHCTVKFAVCVGITATVLGVLVGLQLTAPARVVALVDFLNANWSDFTTGLQDTWNYLAGFGWPEYQPELFATPTGIDWFALWAWLILFCALVAITVIALLKWWEPKPKNGPPATELKPLVLVTISLTAGYMLWLGLVDPRVPIFAWASLATPSLAVALSVGLVLVIEYAVVAAVRRRKMTGHKEITLTSSLLAFVAGTAVADFTFNVLLLPLTGWLYHLPSAFDVFDALASWFASLARAFS